MNAQAISQNQSADCFLNGQNLVASGHPEHIGNLGFPQSRRVRLAEGRHERSRFIEILLGAQQYVSDHVRVNDSFHERPAAIHSSISPAVGRRVWRFHAAATWSSTERRSET